MDDLIRQAVKSHLEEEVTREDALRTLQTALSAGGHKTLGKTGLQRHISAVYDQGLVSGTTRYDYSRMKTSKGPKPTVAPSNVCKAVALRVVRYQGLESISLCDLGQVVKNEFKKMRGQGVTLSVTQLNYFVKVLRNRFGIRCYTPAVL